MIQYIQFGIQLMILTVTAVGLYHNLKSKIQLIQLKLHYLQIQYNDSLLSKLIEIERNLKCKDSELYNALKDIEISINSIQTRCNLQHKD